MMLKQNNPYFEGFGSNTTNADGNPLPTIEWLPMLRKKKSRMFCRPHEFYNENSILHDQRRLFLEGSYRNEDTSSFDTPSSYKILVLV